MSFFWKIEKKWLFIINFAKNGWTFPESMYFKSWILVRYFWFRFGKPNQNFGFGSFGIYLFWLSTVAIRHSTAFSSDGSSLRLGPGSARARHLEGLLELGFCRLDPSIGRGQASGSSLRPQARARLELGNWRLDPSLAQTQHQPSNTEPK